MYIECHGSGSPTALLISGTPPDFGAVVDRTNSAAQYDFRLALTRVIEPTGGPSARSSGEGIVPTQDGDEHTEGARYGHYP
jgi:hypothetical protein